MQKAAGLSNPRVYHSADSNKSEIVVVFDTKETKMAKASPLRSISRKRWRRPVSSTSQRSIFLIRSIEGVDWLRASAPFLLFPGIGILSHFPATPHLSLRVARTCGAFFCS